LMCEFRRGLRIRLAFYCGTTH